MKSDHASTLRQHGLLYARRWLFFLIIPIMLISISIVCGWFSVKVAWTCIITGTIWGGLLFSSWWFGKPALHSLALFVGIPVMLMGLNSSKEHANASFVQALGFVFLPLGILIALLHRQLTGRIEAANLASSAPVNTGKATLLGDQGDSGGKRTKQ